MSNKNKEQKETENIINNDTDNTQQVPENDTPL